MQWPPCDSVLAFRLATAWANQEAVQRCYCPAGGMSSRVKPVSQVESGECHWSTTESTLALFKHCLSHKISSQNIHPFGLTAPCLSHSFFLKISLNNVKCVFCFPPCSQHLSPTPPLPSHLICNLTKLHFFELLAHRSSSHSTDLPIHARSCTVSLPHQ